MKRGRHFDDLTERKKRRIAWWNSQAKQKQDSQEDAASGNERKNSKEGKPAEEKPAEEKVPDQGESEGDTPLDGKNRNKYIVFLGNLPYKVTTDDIKNHFKKPGNIRDVRLLTSKDTGESRGCAFVEFSDSRSYLLSLQMHHSVLGGRRINVEATCGGGGTGKERKKKLAVQQKKMKAVIERKIKRKQKA
eukprot:m.4772 g.4772  ORF g.4772 m.4772 type:complete len:190 (+) comp11264_c0_seq1:10-579(+)